MASDRIPDDLDLYQEAMTDEEREEIAAASVALDLARLFYAAREQRGLTQKQAAGRAGTQQQMISRLEGGTAQPTFKTVERYLRKLGFSIEISLFDSEHQEVVDRLILNEEDQAVSNTDKSTNAMVVGR